LQKLMYFASAKSGQFVNYDYIDRPVFDI